MSFYLNKLFSFLGTIDLLGPGQHFYLYTSCIYFNQQNLDAHICSTGVSGDVQYGRYAALLSFKSNAQGNTQREEFKNLTFPKNWRDPHYPSVSAGRWTIGENYLHLVCYMLHNITHNLFSDSATSSIARGVCQHIIGLAPTHIR